MLCPVLSCIGSIASPHDAHSKMNLNLCFVEGPHNAISTALLLAGSDLGLGIDVHGIHSAKIRAARNSDRVTHHAVSTAWEESLLHRSMAFRTMEAHHFVCRLDRFGAVVRSARNPTSSDNPCQQTSCCAKTFLPSAM